MSKRKISQKTSKYQEEADLKTFREATKSLTEKTMKKRKQSYKVKKSKKIKRKINLT